jgi:ribosomal protein S18 acetylase RimI-like enzyme
VLRGLGRAEDIVPVLTDRLTAGTRAVVGPVDAVSALANRLPPGHLRHIEVRETIATGDPQGLVTVPSMDQLVAFAQASFDAFSEEIGYPPAPRPLDADYLSQWSRRAAGGLVLGSWEDDRCVFRAEVRPVVGMTAEVRGLWLVDELRGQGHALAFLRDLISVVGTRIAPRVQVLVDRANEPAVRLYERAGLDRVGTLARFDIASPADPRVAS